ncbi:MAG: P-loop NTPase [Chloroflexota bacterium]|jgi:Mrp family chromosome partitioning ATPase/NifU-like protein involved in Fe-S cluster formation|nr:P-loop NTPase [Chloroflexota bacterium]
MNNEKEKGQSPQAKQVFQGKAAQYNHIKNAIAVMSGKGGVGKSFVTGLLASVLSHSGYKVGVLDADITGPSIPMLFGLHGPVGATDEGILPLESQTGIKVMSMNLLLPEEDQAVIWRGPLVSRTIQQLWGDVVWGDLDILLIDLPPGTSDASLTIMQSVPLNGLVMVTTPQSLASMVVRKAVHMAQIVDVDIIGIVENMAYYNCPDIGKKHFIFGESHTDEIVKTAQAPLLAQIPIDPEITRRCDAGEVEKIRFEGLNTLLHEFLRAADIEEKSEHVDIEDGYQEQQQEKHQPDLSDYSPTAQEIIKNRENMGKLKNPDLRGKYQGCCGDSMQIELGLDGDVIQEARFTTDGCEATIACGGMLTRMIKGKTLEQAGSIQSQALVEALGGLPEDHVHCAELSISALRETIENGQP